MAERQSLYVSSVENLIFSLLLNTKTDYDYPDLIEEAVENIASSLTDVIGGVLKQKSTANSARRTNVLRFLNTVCQTKEPHQNNDSYKIYLQAYKDENIIPSKSQELQEFFDSNNIELKAKVSTNLCTNVLDFCRKKNAMKKEKCSKLEYIKNMDQKRLDLANLWGAQVHKKINFYESDEHLVHDILEDKESNITERTDTITANCSESTLEYREKQTKFCYAILNVGDQEDYKILETVLKKFNNYESLERFEVNFLIYLWSGEEEKLSAFTTYITEKFPFVIEKVILTICTQILLLGQDEPEVSNYFLSLTENIKVQKLSKLCLDNKKMYYMVKNLIFELYCYSFCNRNILKLGELLL